MSTHSPLLLRRLLFRQCLRPSLLCCSYSLHSRYLLLVWSSITNSECRFLILGHYSILCGVLCRFTLTILSVHCTHQLWSLLNLERASVPVLPDPANNHLLHYLSLYFLRIGGSCGNKVLPLILELYFLCSADLPLLPHSQGKRHSRDIAYVLKTQTYHPLFHACLPIPGSCSLYLHHSL